MEPETPHHLGTESTNVETEDTKSNLVDPFASAFTLKEPTLVIDETIDITSNSSNYLLLKPFFNLPSAFYQFNKYKYYLSRKARQHYIPSKTVCE